MNEYLQDIIEHARQIQYKAEHISKRKSIPEINQGLEEIYEELKWVFRDYRILKRQISGEDHTFEDFLKEVKKEELEGCKKRDDDH